MAQDKVYLKENPIYWIPVGVLYSNLVEHASEYDINPDYFTRHALTGILKKFGFKKAKKQGGISWFITTNEVNEVRERMGYIQPVEGSLDNFTDYMSQSNSEGSDTAKSSDSGTAG